MAWNLDGRVALITGGASGIGAELARQLSARGMRLGLIDIDADRLEGIVPGAETAVADVRDAEALTAAIDDLARRLGGLDIAVANAGIATGGPLRMVAPETVEETIDVNLLGVWRTARASLPYVLERRGYVLLVASAAAVAPMAGLGAYSASKAGVEGLGRGLRAELAPPGGRAAGCCAPSWRRAACVSASPTACSLTRRWCAVASRCPRSAMPGPDSPS